MTTPAEQHNQSAEAKVDEAKTAIDKPKVPMPLRKWPRKAYFESQLPHLNNLKPMARLTRSYSDLPLLFLQKEFEMLKPKPVYLPQY